MPRYQLVVRSRFEAAHHLSAYRGAPEAVHGHSWRVEVSIGAPELGAEGYVVDFVAIQSRLDALAARFHHRDINVVPPFDRQSPTTEHLARWFFHEMTAWLAELPPEGGASTASVLAVTVWEGPDCAATILRDSGR